MRVRLATASALTLVCCGLPELAIEGKSCGPSDPCPAPFLCVAPEPSAEGRCGRAAPPDAGGAGDAPDGAAVPDASLSEDSGLAGDAAIADAGGGADGSAADTGGSDAAGLDASSADAGSTSDAASSTDASEADAGAGSDASLPADASMADAGACAGCELLTLQNPGFETALEGWEPLDADSVIELQATTVHTGTGAMKISFRSGGTGSFVGMRLARRFFSNLQEGATYCVAGWVQRGSLGSRLVQLVMRTHTASTAWIDAEAAKVTPVDDGWFRIQAKAVAGSPYLAALDFRLISYASTGAVFYADDFVVWRDPSGRCDEP